MSDVGVAGKRWIDRGRLHCWDGVMFRWGFLYWVLL